MRSKRRELSMSHNETIEEPLDALDLMIPNVRKRSDMLYKIKEELSKESDRGCALVASAYLENELTELLSCFFVELDRKREKAVWDFTGPVGTFSSKIKLAFALGLISDELEKSLDNVRDIRNKFAHLQEPLTFDSDQIKSRVLNILPTSSIKESDIRNNFILKMQSIVALMHLLIAGTLQRKEPEHVFVAIQESKPEHDFDIAARYMMNITFPKISYEQGLEMVTKLSLVKYQ